MPTSGGDAHGGGDAHRGGDARRDTNLIGTAMVCGTVLGATWMVVRSLDRNSREWQRNSRAWQENSREWQESVRPVGDFFESLRFGHEEDIRDQGPFWRQWGRFVSTIRGGRPPNARGGTPPNAQGGDARPAQSHRRRGD